MSTMAVWNTCYGDLKPGANVTGHLKRLTLGEVSEESIEVRGFFLEIIEDGSRSWFYCFRLSKPISGTIEYTAMTVQKALSD